MFRYFQTLPLPQLTTAVQPPGGTVLVGLPTIFYTDAPIEQVFTVDIRGFAVVITAGAQSFTWHTGDGDAVVISDGPGAPYPEQTVTYDYTSGSYSTYLTVTWGGTFTVDGSAPVEVAGTTTTDGPAVQLTAVAGARRPHQPLRLTAITDRRGSSAPATRSVGRHMTLAHQNGRGMGAQRRSTPRAGAGNSAPYAWSFSHLAASAARRSALPCRST